MTKKQAILKIKSKPSTYLNDDQKTVAIGIINSIPKGEDVLKYFDFIMKRSDVGFKFDVAPEIATGRIAVVNEMKNLNINTSEEIDINENKLIIGDNYEALKNLLLTHKEKIDVIYIDPPYNTEKSKEDGNASSKEGEHSKFIYKDKFGRNGWLNMMRERLILAKRLLTNEGVIFVSIDDKEQAYLKVLMDEIFGEEHFIKNLIWQTNNSVMKGSKDFRKDHEYILLYTKRHTFNFNKTTNETLKFINPDNDPKGAWISTNATFKINKKHQNYYPIKYKGITFYKTWRFSKKDYEKGLINLYFKNNNVPRLKIYKKDYNLFNKTPSTILMNNLSLIKNKMETFSTGRKQIFSILQKDFDTPKPINLIKWLIDRINNKTATVLDFFAGTGTTGHAVMQLNKEDNGNRKFILVTNNENDIGINTTYNRLYRIVKGKTIEGKNDFNWIKNNDPYNNASLRVFNIKHFDVETNQSKELDSITKIAVKNLNKLNPLYKIKATDIQIYYDLDGLNPLNEAQKKQLYSTDKIIHEKSTKKLTFEKNYCTCGKSFNKNDELIQHIEKQNN